MSTRLEELRQEKEKRESELVGTRGLMTILEQDPNVLQYKNYSEKLPVLSEQVATLDFEMQLEAMRNHLHLYVMSGEVDDKKYYSCIRCPLDTMFSHLESSIFSLTPVQAQMESIYDETLGNSLLLSEKYIQRDLGRAVYQFIISRNPNITDEQLIKYCRAILNNVTNRDLSKDDKDSKLKRLGLDPNMKYFY